MNLLCPDPRAWVVTTTSRPDLVLRACDGCYAAYNADGLILVASRIVPEPEPEAYEVKALAARVAELEAERTALIVIVERADERASSVRAALTRAGLPEHEEYPTSEQTDAWEASLRSGGRMVPPHERVARLAEERDAARARVGELETEVAMLRQDVREARRGPPF